MRILRINAWAGPAPGGTEVYIRRVSRALEERGHPNVTAALVTDPPAESLGPIETFTVPRSLGQQSLREPFERDRLRRWLDGVARAAKPDLIHLHHFRAGFLALGPWLAGRPEPIVFTVHDPELVCPVATLTLPDGSHCPGGILPRCQLTGCPVGFGLPQKLAGRYSFDRYVRDRVRTFICVSHATRAVFENLGYRPTDLLRPMIPFPAEAAPAPSGPFTIGFLGRVDAQKGVSVLLRAFETVRSTRPEVRLRFGGTGPYPIPGLPGISTDGWVSDSFDWLAGIHVLAAPSIGWENLGNSPIEALARGVPVIVSDSGGLPETVGEFGTVVPQGSADALAAAIVRTIEAYPNARELALRGREWVREEFSGERHLSGLLGIYERELRAPTRENGVGG